MKVEWNRQGRRLEARNRAEGTGPVGGGAGLHPVIGLSGEGTSRRDALILLGIVLVAWATFAWPLLSGERTFVLRDVLSVHFAYKWFGAQELAQGSIPAINPTWGLGQNFRGNPSTVPFYPGNIFYLVLPFWSAFSLHFMLHWLLGFFGMRSLARAIGQSAEAAILSALAYSCSGLFLSLLSFYNLIAVAAWAPIVLRGLVRGGRSGIAASGLACGLMLLAGEPVFGALLLPAMVAASSAHRGWIKGVQETALVGFLGLLVALPQIIASSRILDFSYRGAHGLGAAQVVKHSLHPGRLFELLLPLPWGWPDSVGDRGFWSDLVTPGVPYIFSLHTGVVAVVLAVVAARSHPRWSVLAAAGLFLAWASGLSGEVTRIMTGGVFRYPQKLLFLFTIAAAPLAGWGLDRARSSPGAVRLLRALGILCTVAGIVALAAQPSFAELLRLRLARGGDASLASVAAASWTVGLIAAGITLLLAAWALARGRPALAILVQFLAFLQFAPVVPTDAVINYRLLAPLGQEVETPRALVSLPVMVPEWEPRPLHRIADGGVVDAIRLKRLNVEPAFGAAHGIRYPVAMDIEGMSSPLAMFVNENLAILPWSQRLPWLRRLGVGWVLRYGQEPVPGFSRLAAETHLGVTVGLDQVHDPGPFVRWPHQVTVARSPIDAFLAIARGGLGSGESADLVAVASRPVAHRPGAVAALFSERPDRIEIDVVGEGGLLVVARAWQPIYRARLADGTPLATLPVDVVLLGVEVPAGRQRVVIDVSSVPETIAGIVAALIALALAVVAWRAR